MEHPTPRAMLRRGLDVRRKGGRNPRKRRRARQSSAHHMVSADGHPNDYSTKAALTIFPDIKNVVFTYGEENIFASPAGGVAVQVFRANSLFDPNFTGVGNQPRYFDTLCGATAGTAPYHNYAVHACKIDCYIRNRSNSHLIAAVSVSTASTLPPATIQEARERSDTIVRTVAPLGSGGPFAKLVMYAKMSKILGMKDIMDNAGAKADYNANAVDEVKYSISVFNPDSGITEGSTVSTRLTFYAKLFELNDVADS